jgi:hypothetical protein
MTAQNSEEWVPNSSISDAIFPIERNLEAVLFPIFAWSPWKQPQTTSSKIR